MIFFFFPVALNFLIISSISLVCLRGNFFGKLFAEPVPTVFVTSGFSVCCRNEQSLRSGVAAGSYGGAGALVGSVRSWSRGSRCSCCRPGLAREMATAGTGCGHVPGSPASKSPVCGRFWRGFWPWEH